MGYHNDERIADQLEEVTKRACGSLAAVDYTNFVGSASAAVQLLAEGLDHVAGHLGENEGVTPYLQDEAKALREAAERVFQLVDRVGDAMRRREARPAG